MLVDDLMRLLAGFMVCTGLAVYFARWVIPVAGDYRDPRRGVALVLCVVFMPIAGVGWLLRLLYDDFHR